MAELHSLVDDKYELLKEIGHGGMSTVYLAIDRRLNKQWAIKEIRKDGGRAALIQSALVEAHLIKNLDYPALPRIVDITENKRSIFIIMDYIDGRPLSEVLKEEGAQPQGDVVSWGCQLCGVLTYLHTRTPPVIHRDMKPGNIMLRPDGSVKLIDFGIARELRPDGVRETMPLGTPGYAAPEQMERPPRYDARTDIFCLGATLYHLLTGNNPAVPPHAILPIRQCIPTLSDGLERILLKCVEKDPAGRYQTAAELQYALEHYRAYDDSYRAAREKRVRRFLLPAALAVIFLVTGVVGQGLHAQAENTNYTTLIAQAQRAAQAKDAQNDLLRAIQMQPDRMDAYTALVRAYEQDTDFTVDEETQLKQAIGTRLADLRRQPGYASLAFEIAKLYWYYYDYGRDATDDNQVTRMKSAVQWFDDVLQYGSKNASYYTMARVYADIGKFNRDITLNVQEASDAGKYLSYWKSLSQLSTWMDQNSGGENELVQLEWIHLGLNAIGTYAHKFKEDGVKQEDMTQVLSLISSHLEKLQTTMDKTAAMKKSELALLPDAQQALSLAYTDA